MRIFDADIRSVREHSYCRGTEVEIEFEDGRAIVIKTGAGYNHPDGGALVELINNVADTNTPPSDSVVLDPSD